MLSDLRLIIHYLKPHKFLVVLNLSIMTIMALIQGVGIGMLVPLMESLSGGAEPNVFTQALRTGFAVCHIPFNFNTVTVAFACITLLRLVVEAAQHHYNRVLTATVSATLQETMFDNLMTLPLAFYYKQKIGDLTATQFTSSVNCGGMVDQVNGLLKSGFMIIMFLITGCLISVKMTVMIVFMGLLSFFLVQRSFKIVQARAQQEKELIDQIHCFLYDTFSGIKSVKNFYNETRHRSEYTKLVTSFKKCVISIMDSKIASTIRLESFLFVMIIATLLIAVNIWHMQLVSLIVILFIFVQMVPEVKNGNRCILGIKQLIPHVRKVHELIDRTDKHYLPDSLREFSRFERDIRLEHVSFRYNETEEYVLRDIDMVIKRGKTVALVGSSGAGKTTLVDLIMRYHDPSEGRIMIDGRFLKEEIGIASWRRQIGCVEQHPFIFNETIYANILYGRPDASREEVIKAATLAYAHDFIIALPRGYDAVVGDRGITLSGGQQQRIALARVLLKNPAILILDEATSALDSESESYIQLAMERLRMTRTLVIIAHRLSTIVNADEIFFLEGGRIVETGNHEALIEYGGRYRSFYELQLGNPRKEA